VKELILDLREAEIDGDFTWMILSYVEDKKNTLSLLETGSGGRKGLVEYLRASHNGALDKVLYILIKEDDSTNKCTFVCWIGFNVPAFYKASTSTHRGAISNWLSTVVHSVKEEYVQSGNDLLGLKDVESPRNPQNADGSELFQSQCSGISEVEKKMQSRPYAGKVLDEVKRDKTPQEIWMERKQGQQDTPRSQRRHMSADHLGSLDNSHIDMLGLGHGDGEKEFAQVGRRSHDTDFTGADGLVSQVQLKSRAGSNKNSGRSKYAKKSGDSPRVTTRSCDMSAMTKTELQAAAAMAACEAKMLEEVLLLVMPAIRSVL
jgi:hypothetical protein